jgi:hypothetical protein
VPQRVPLPHNVHRADGDGSVVQSNVVVDERRRRQHRPESVQQLRRHECVEPGESEEECEVVLALALVVGECEVVLVLALASGV